MDLAFLSQHLPSLLLAAYMTVKLTLATLALSTLIAIPLAVWRMRDGTKTARVIGWYSALMRALPTLVVLYFVYYGLPQIGLVLPAFPTALAGLTLSATAYNLEIFRSGLMTVKLGQFEAARALAIPAWRMWLGVIIPQALPVIVPVYLSNATLVMKGTSVASIITISELTAKANELVSETYRPFEILLAATVIYILLGGALSLAARRLRESWAWR